MSMKCYDELLIAVLRGHSDKPCDTTGEDFREDQEECKPKPAGSGGEQVQSDWNQSDETAPDFIKNKPEKGGGGGVGQQIEGGGEIFNIGQGDDNTASGVASHAEGSKTKATGDYSHAEGYNNEATKNGAHVEGAHCRARREYAHAEGRNTTASGEASHAEGYLTYATGENAHAEGQGTTASGKYSHTEGQETTASANYAHAEGYHSIASGTCTHAEGCWTLASSMCQHTQGKYNIEDGDNVYSHIVGNGTSDSERSNAHTLDWSGNAWYAGTVEGTAMIVKSSTEGSTKRFKITVDDSGTISAAEITE